MRHLILLAQTLEDLPGAFLRDSRNGSIGSALSLLIPWRLRPLANAAGRYITIKLLYYDNTPADYEPPFFCAAPDSGVAYSEQPVTIKVGEVCTPYHALRYVPFAWRHS